MESCGHSRDPGAQRLRLLLRVTWPPPASTGGWGWGAESVGGHAWPAVPPASARDAIELVRGADAAWLRTGVRGCTQRACVLVQVYLCARVSSCTRACGSIKVTWSEERLRSPDQRGEPSDPPPPGPRAQGSHFEGPASEGRGGLSRLCPQTLTPLPAPQSLPATPAPRSGAVTVTGRPQTQCALCPTRRSLV